MTTVGYRGGEPEEVVALNTQFRWNSNPKGFDQLTYDTFEDNLTQVCEDPSSDSASRKSPFLGDDERSKFSQCAGELNTSDARLVASITALATGLPGLFLSQMTKAVGRFRKDVRSTQFSENPVVSHRKKSLKTLLGDSSLPIESIFTLAAEVPRPEEYGKMSLRQAFTRLSICKAALSTLGLALVTTLLEGNREGIKRRIEEDQTWKMANVPDLNKGMNWLLDTVKNITRELLPSDLQSRATAHSTIRRNVEIQEGWMKSRMGEGDLSATFRVLYEAEHPAAVLGMTINDVRLLTPTNDTLGLTAPRNASHAMTAITEISSWPLSFKDKEEPYYSEGLITKEMMITDAIQASSKSLTEKGSMASLFLEQLLTEHPSFLSELKKRREEGNDKLVAELYMDGRWSGTLSASALKEVNRLQDSQTSNKEKRVENSIPVSSSSIATSVPPNSLLTSNSHSPGKQRKQEKRGKRRGRGKGKGRGRDEPPSHSTTTPLTLTLNELNEQDPTKDNLDDQSVGTEDTAEAVGPPTHSEVMSSQGSPATQATETSHSQNTEQSVSASTNQQGRSSSTTAAQPRLTESSIPATTMGDTHPHERDEDSEDSDSTLIADSEPTPQVMEPIEPSTVDWVGIADTRLPVLDKKWLVTFALAGKEWWETYAAATGLSIKELAGSVYNTEM